jgi:hypothetical protein
MALSCHPTTTSVPLTLAHLTVLIDSLSQPRQSGTWNALGKITKDALVAVF